MLPSPRYTWMLCTTALILVTTGRAAASPALRAKLRPLAKQIHTVVAVEEKQDAVAFTEIPGDPFSASNSGAGIQRLLIEELQAVARNKNFVKEKARLVVRGDYHAVKTTDEQKRKILVVKITVSVLTDEGRELMKSDVVIDDVEEIAVLTGVTTPLLPTATGTDRNGQLQSGLNQPQVRIEGTRIFSRKGQPFAVEVLAKKPGDAASQPRQPLNLDGRAFVELAKGDTYELLIHNKANFDAVFKVTIDGLDIFTFSEDLDPITGQSRYEHYLVPANKTVCVFGWHKTLDPKRQDNVLSFLVTEYGKGAASSRRVVGKTGTITVSFAASWTGEEKRPADEDDPGIRLKMSKEILETGRGPARQVPFREAPRATVGVVRDLITVRYDRTKN